MALSDAMNYQNVSFNCPKRSFKSNSNKTFRQHDENIMLWANCSTEGILVADLRGKILYANPSVKNLTNYSQSELENLGLGKLFKVYCNKPWLRPNDKRYKKKGTNSYRRFKAEMIQKEDKTIAVKGKTARTTWICKPAIIIIFKAIKQTNKREIALKCGIQKMQHLVETKKLELEQVNKQLRQIRQTLDHKNHEVKDLNKELLETNGALSALARHLDKEKKTFESEISRSIITNILPIVKTLQQDNKLSRYTLELNLLESYIGGLSPSGLKYQGMFCCLSETEGKIATLIKRGMTSKKIAALLCVSSETVRTHRRNIRRKLKIQNTNVNLRAYLNKSPQSKY